jgi:FkbM family methyltransferase
MTIDGLTTATDVLRDQLEALLSESGASALKRQQTAFDQIAAPFEQKLVLFGAGGFGRRTLAGLRRVGIEPLAFADNNPALWGHSVCGVPVLSPADAAERYGRSAAFVVTIWHGRSTDRMSGRVRQLTELGCERVALAGLLFWKYPDIFLPCYHLDLPHKVLSRAKEARAGFDLWEDDASRSEYLAQLRFRLFLDFDGLGAPDATPYVSRLASPSAHEVYVDCGAFDGDTILSFLDRRAAEFESIIAFEPDPLNWAKLGLMISALPDAIRAKIQCFQQAVGNFSGDIRFDVTGTDLSAVGSGTTTVACIELDKALKDVTPTTAKFDIEGYELEALEGARATIDRCHPVLEVSAYHLQSHLWEVPLSIAAIAPEQYSHFLCAHGTEGWDLVSHSNPQKPAQMKLFLNRGGNDRGNRTAIPLVRLSRNVDISNTIPQEAACLP